MSDREILAAFFPDVLQSFGGGSGARPARRPPDYQTAFFQLAKGQGLTRRQAEQAWTAQFGRG